MFVLVGKQLEKQLAAAAAGGADDERAKAARAEADAARERAETIQRSRNCEWLRLRWHAVATCACQSLVPISIYPLAPGGHDGQALLIANCVH